MGGTRDGLASRDQCYSGHGGLEAEEHCQYEPTLTTDSDSRM